jgi:glutamyl-tRNA reductase
MVESEAGDRTAAIAEAETIVATQAQAFRGQLHANGAVPTVLALRHRLDEICRQELESFIEERGPFTREQHQSLHAITNQVIQKIASFLARELKELPEKEEQDQMTAAVTRLFRLESPQTALAGTRLGRERNERSKEQQIAINY